MTSLMKSAVVAAAMLIASGGAIALKPTEHMSRESSRTRLEELVPTQFGAWTIDRSVTPIAASPDVQAEIAKIYSETISRTYINDQGQRVMLSIAYGGEQSDALRAHKPEVCYTAQGFTVSKVVSSMLNNDALVLPIRQLEAVMGLRREPITYWMTVGDIVVRTGFEQKLAQLKYGLNGKVPDGMLVRVSSIDRDRELAYRIQDRFIVDLRLAIPASARSRFFGA
jgi:EpsI family protein